MKNLFLLVVGVVLTFMGCSSNKDTGDCSEALCTMVFISIPISVVDENGNSVKLDSYEVKEVETGKIRDVGDWSVPEYNIYPAVIASDFDREEFFNRKVRLQLTGKIDGKVVVQEIYTVTADCCHVYLVEGNKEVVIKK